jgi:uracil-DNA glycosylase
MTEPKKRGRPKTKVEATPLHVFPGDSKTEQLKGLFQQWWGCRRCFLGENRDAMYQTQEIVFADGNPDGHVMFIGEAPGEHEQNESIPFVGPSGKLLNMILANSSDDPQVINAYETYRQKPNLQAEEWMHNIIFEWRRQNYFFTNVVACRPPDNRPPNNIEIKACWERVWNIIYIVDPLVIVACGKTALTALTKKQMEITKVRGQLIDVEYDGRLGKLVYPVVPIFHPSYLLRVADYKVKGGNYERTVSDVLKAMMIADTLREKYYGTPMPKRREIG